MWKTRRGMLGGSLALAGGAAAPLMWIAIEGREAKAADGPSAPQSAPSLSAYGKLPLIEAVTLAPSGTRVALSMDRTGQKVIYDFDIVSEKSSARTIEGSTLRALMWVDEDSLLAVTTIVAKLRDFVGDANEFEMGILVNTRLEKTFQLYANMDQFASVVMGDFNRIQTDHGARVTAGNVKIYAGGVRSLYSFSPQSGDGYLMDEAPYDIVNWVVEPNGHVLGRCEHDRDSHVWTLRYHDGQTWSIIHTEKAAIDAPELVGLGRDGKSLLVWMPSESKSGQYFEIGVKGIFSDPLTPGPFQELPIFHPLTRILVGFKAINSRGVVSYRFFDPQMAKLPALIDTALPGSYFNTIVAMADDPRKMIVYTEAPGDTGSYYFLDFKSGNSKVVGTQYPNIPAEWVGEKKAIQYEAGDGTRIEAFVTFPPNLDPKDRACVLLPHGGPESHDRLGFDWLAQALASRGYVVLQPNFRGSDGYGEAFVALGHGQWGRKMQSDLSDGVTALAKQGLIDPKRVAILGGSYGGYAALAGAALQPDLYRCAIAIAPISDIKSFVDWSSLKENKNYNSSRVLYWRRFLGDESGWDAISPARQASNVKCPVLLIHGRDDVTVPIEQSYKMQEALKAAHRRVDFVLLKAEDHYLSKEETRVQALEAAVAFLLANNPPL